MKKRGISLIILIITIIVVIILAAVVILTLSKNNPIESAKEARFKEDIRTFQNELSLAVSKEYANAGGHRDEKITTSNFDEIKEYIPSFSEKYRDKFVIQDDKLQYTKKLNEKEKEYAQSLNVEEIRGLPPEYQQVEYIESTGTQYIKTQVQNEYIDYKFVFDMTFLSEYSEYGKSFLGDASSRFYIGGTGVGYYNVCYNGESYKELRIIRNVKTHNIVIASPGIQQWIVDDESIKVSSSKTETINSNNQVYVFKGRDGNGYGSPAKLRLFNMKIYIYSQDKLVRDYIPCYSIVKVTDVNGKECPIGTIGMYDTVEGKFYTNQGTGEFVTGPEV